MYTLSYHFLSGARGCCCFIQARTRTSFSNSAGGRLHKCSAYRGLLNHLATSCFLVARFRRCRRCVWHLGFSHSKSVTGRWIYAPSTESVRVQQHPWHWDKVEVAACGDKQHKYELWFLFDKAALDCQLWQQHHVLAKLSTRVQTFCPYFLLSRRTRVRFWAWEQQLRVE